VGHATLEQIKESMGSIGLCAGERRTYERCRSCKQIMVREFIPYGLGRGRTFNPCMCYLTGNDKKSGYERLEEIDGPLPWPQPEPDREVTIEQMPVELL